MAEQHFLKGDSGLESTALHSMPRTKVTVFELRTTCLHVQLFRHSLLLCFDVYKHKITKRIQNRTGRIWQFGALAVLLINLYGLGFAR